MLKYNSTTQIMANLSSAIQDNWYRYNSVVLRVMHTGKSHERLSILIYRILYTVFIPH